MEEKEFLCKIKQLRNIKPSQNWVSLTKVKVLREEPKANWLSVLEFFPRLIYRHSRLAFASLIIFGFVVGSFGFAQGALPGDPIYALKRASEKTRLAFVSERDLPQAQLAFVNKRLEELSTIAQTNQVKKIAPAVKEFQANIAKAAKDLVAAKDVNLREIASETRKIKESRQKIESLGVVVGETKEFDDALAQLVERELEDLKERTVTKEQRDILFQAKDDFGVGNYNQALEKILLLNYLQN